MAIVQRQAIKQLNKLKQSSGLGIALGHKMGVDLSGYLALHFYKDQYRIVYKVLEDQKYVLLMPNPSASKGPRVGHF